MSDLGDWCPLYGAHAIEQVNAKVLFTQAVTDIPWKQIQERAREKSRKLQLVTERPIHHIDFLVSDSPERSKASPKEVGIEFLRLERPNFYSDKLAIERQGLLFESFRYTRWKSFENKINDAFSPILSMYLSSVPILGIQVEYVDRFNSTQPERQPDCTAVIRSPSEFIAAGALKRNEAWHCHVGFFEKADEATKRLVNLDVDVADLSQRDVGGATVAVRTIRIRTHLRDLFNQNDYDRMPDEKVTPEFVTERINVLHAELKGLLSAAITEDAAKAISLVGDENV